MADASSPRHSHPRRPESRDQEFFSLPHCSASSPVPWLSHSFHPLTIHPLTSPHNFPIPQPLLLTLWFGLSTACWPRKSGGKVRRRVRGGAERQPAAVAKASVFCVGWRRSQRHRRQKTVAVTASASASLSKSPKETFVGWLLVVGLGWLAAAMTIAIWGMACWPGGEQTKTSTAFFGLPHSLACCLPLCCWPLGNEP